MSQFPSLADLQSDCNQPLDPAWRAKMLHKVPDAPVVDRVAFILERCKGKNVLNVGSASGTLHESIKNVARQVWGVDKKGPGVDFDIDVDETGWTDVVFPDADVDLIVCGEVLEHLANPGQFVQGIRSTWHCEVLITVPNAFHASKEWANDGIECVNRDHCSWYSWRTLKTLVERYGFEIQEFCWYNGQPMFAEGIIMVVR